MKMSKTRKNKTKGSKIQLMNRYGFFGVFQTSPATGLLFPRVHVVINNLRYPAYYNIPRGISFGGLDLYNYVGRDIAGTFDQTTSTLTMVGFY